MSGPFMNAKISNLAFGIYTGTVDITHLATGATNNFANYEYVVFGGRKNEKDPSKYVELSRSKTEQQAQAAVEKTRGQIAPASKTAPQ
jgi:hypothetical protein